MTERKITKQDCSGCYNNFYNGTGVKECWSFADATMEKLIVIHRDQMPPYKEKLQWKPVCWYGNNGLRAIRPKYLDAEGYWK